MGWLALPWGHRRYGASWWEERGWRSGYCGRFRCGLLGSEAWCKVVNGRDAQSPGPRASSFWRMMVDFASLSVVPMNHTSSASM